jgi:hypothetical protein
MQWGQFPSWMLQSTHIYLKAAELLDAQKTCRAFGGTYKLDAVALAAGSSASAKRGQNQPPYKHDPLTLFHAMPEAIRSSSALDSQEDSFEKYRDVFTNSRYPYDLNNWKFSTRC